MQPVAFLESRNLHQLSDITVGNVVNTLDPLQKLVTVLHHHHFVSATELLLFREDRGTDAVVVTVCPLVRTAEDHSVINSITSICIIQRLYKIATCYLLYIFKSFKVEFELYIGVVITLYNFSDDGSIMEDPIGRLSTNFTLNAQLILAKKAVK